MGDSGAILDRLDGADLIVGMHDADKDRARRDRPAKIVGVNPARAVNGQVGHPRAQAFEKPARFDDRRMLDPGGDDVIALVAKREEHALEGKVICLAAAARENDLVVVAAEQRRHLAARRLKSSLCRGRRPMPARRIAVMILKKRLHRGGDRRIDRRAGVVVEIDASHGQNTRTLSASAVAAASSSIVLRRAPAMRAASSRPRASMQVPHKSTLPLPASTRLSIRSTL